jgi:hypothetical protein
MGHVDWASPLASPATDTTGQLAEPAHATVVCAAMSAMEALGRQPRMTAFGRPATCGHRPARNPAYTSVCSAISRASLTSMPR